MSENSFHGKQYYRCPITEGDEYRKKYINSIESFITNGYENAVAKRQSFASPRAMAKDREHYRKLYLEMIGSPAYPTALPHATHQFVAEDDFGRIYRLDIEVMEGFSFYGMLMIPHGITHAPLVIAQHGGGGTPEKCCDMWGENNYGFFAKRALERGKIVFAPQLLLWQYRVADEAENSACGVQYGHRKTYDARLKRLGISLTGLEVFCIRRSIDYLITLDCIDGEKIGMMGLSYGGYFTMYTMAADTRIRAGYACGFFNDRAHECFMDWGYRNSALTFQDAEVAGLCAPRCLTVDVGKTDPVFRYEHSIDEGTRAAAYYEAAGAKKMFDYHLWEGGHRFDVESDGFEKLFSELER